MTAEFVNGHDQECPCIPVAERETFGNPANVTETFASFMCVRGTCTNPVCVSEDLRVQGSQQEHQRVL